jgi:hypothetical protein
MTFSSLGFKIARVGQFVPSVNWSGTKRMTRRHRCFKERAFVYETAAPHFGRLMIVPISDATTAR